MTLFGGPLVVVLSVLVLAGAITVALLLYRQTTEIESNVALTNSLVEANIRVLSQTQRELLRLRHVVADPNSTPETLSLHRGFVVQRLEESSRSRLVATLNENERYQGEVGAQRAYWTDVVLPPLQRLIDGQGSEADRTAALEGLRRMELQYNDIISWSEIERRSLAATASRQIGRIVGDSRRLTTFQTCLLISFGLVLALVARRFLHTDRQRSAAAAEMAGLNRQLRTLSEVARRSDNAVAICEPDGTTIWVNDAFARMTGLGSAATLGRPHWSLLHPSDTAAVIRSSLSAGRWVTHELHLAGTEREALARVEIQPVDDGTDPVDGAPHAHRLIVIYEDITKQRELEQHLRDAARDAQEAADAKARFLATMSHEIRTPLAAVLAMNELLMNSGLNEEQSEYARNALNGGRLLLDLVNDVLIFSRVEAGQIQIERHPFAPVGLVSEVIELLAPQAAEQRVTLRAEVDPATPAAVVGDEARLRQILINLVGNAIKFSSGGNVTVAADWHEDSLRLVVEDNGIGIPAHRLSAVLTPFTQVDASVSRVHGGSGLGLAICLGLAEAMDGSLHLESEEGVGTAVTVAVPMAVAPVPPAVAASGPPDKAAAPAPVRVLVAEDNAMNQRVVSLFLQRLGIDDPVIVDNGEQAVEALRAAPFDVVLMDLHMPVCDGVTAVSRIRAELPADRQPYVIALTADVVATEPEWLERVGMDARLTKPYTIAALADALLDAEAAGAGRPTPTGGFRSPAPRTTP